MHDGASFGLDRLRRGLRRPLRRRRQLDDRVLAVRLDRPHIGADLVPGIGRDDLAALPEAAGATPTTREASAMTVPMRQTTRLAVPLIGLAALVPAALALAALVLAALVLIAPPRPAAAADVAALRGRHIVFVEPYGPDSVTNLPLALMHDEIALKSGAKIDVVPIGGRAGGSALDYVLSPPPAIAEDAIVFAVLDVASRGLPESAGERTKLPQPMQPVATLSGALSSALVVAENSDIRTFGDFLARARAKPLTVVGLGRKAAFGIELAMLEREAGLALNEKIVA